VQLALNPWPTIENSALALAPKGDCSGDPFAEDVVVEVGAEGAGRTKD
jgi:hypothetical protein